MLQTPILFLVFNRLEEVTLVFEQIRQQQPTRLFIAADGPRAAIPGEEALCMATRAYVLEHIDWPCEVKTLFRSTNLGCGKAVSTAIDWFFEEVEEGIILEDDCVPDTTFFSFCTALLERYRDQHHVMHIGGSNFQLGTRRSEASYYFSRHIHVWGWATWRRAWRKYDFSLRPYRQLMKKKNLDPIVKYFLSIFHRHVDTWDIQWVLVVWFNNGCGITPDINLVNNIGYGKNATHTRHVPYWLGKMNYGSIPTVIHPESEAINDVADKFTSDKIFHIGTLPVRIKGALQQVGVLNKIYKRIFL